MVVKFPSIINRGADAHFYSRVYYEVSDLVHSLFDTKTINKIVELIINQKTLIDKKDISLIKSIACAV
ncbi:hypothetical protein ACFL5N_02560 [bacterium]